MSTMTLTKLNKQVKVSSKGQITLPKIFLQRLGLDYGQFISISLNKDKLEIVNQRQILKQKINNLVGSVKPKVKTDLSLEQQIESARQEKFDSQSL
jgi:bifunctional DNA-binding transcriptional regulator/antitoxin component of YhaV-PrlF toxin-antitoxin module